MDTVWYWIDPLLSALNFPITEPTRWVILSIITLLSLALLYVLASFIDDALMSPSSNKGNNKAEEGPSEVRKTARPESLADLVLRGKWRFYLPEDYRQIMDIRKKREEGEQIGEEEEPEAAFLGFAVEADTREFQLFFGQKQEDAWYRFANHINLTDTARIQILSIFKHLWLGEPEEDENDVEGAAVDMRSWKDVLRGVSNNPLEEGTEFSWDLYTNWRIEDYLGSYMVDVDGNRFFQGGELVTLYTFRSKDKQAEQYSGMLNLLIFVEYVDGRAPIGGKVVLWEGGSEVSSQEAIWWQNEDYVVSNDMIKEVMKH